MMLENYQVRFWLKKPDGYWDPQTEVFQSAGKNGHSKAEKQFQHKYRNKTVKLISVVYQ